MVHIKCHENNFRIYFSIKIIAAVICSIEECSNICCVFLILEHECNLKRKTFLLV